MAVWFLVLGILIGTAARFVFGKLLGTAARLIARLCEFASAASERIPAPPSACPRDATQAQQQTDVVPASPREATQAQQQTDVVPSIFLSHSGKQKGFVERLNDHLVNAGYYPFFDQHSIPKGAPFPEYIRKAATRTKVGVVILSDDFMTSKWPMIELELLTNSSAEVIPLFYKLSPHDVKSPAKLSQWRKKWEEMAQKDRTIDVSGWAKAVQGLASQTGEVYKSETSEGDYIKKIVKAIYAQLPPPVTYDLSYAKGKDRFIEEVKTQFQRALVACKPGSNTPIIGMHGVAGLGKSTLCKVMANFYTSEYSGKSAVIEFPSKMDKVQIVTECKKVLKLLTGADNMLLEFTDDFDKAVLLMKQRMKKEAVFLALDNVWEHSLEEARRILEAGFGAGSKVMVTSRSKTLLEDLLKDSDSVIPVPSVNKVEALETFQTSFGADLPSISRESLDRVLRLCMFDGSYHPLALKALGRKLKNMGGANAVRIKRNLGLITFDLQGSKIEDLIKTSYNGLSSIAQRMFLDVAVIFIRTGSFKSGSYEIGFEEVCEWLSILYEHECADDEIIHQMKQLALEGLLQIEGIVSWEPCFEKQRVVVHDLYVALAEREAAESSRLLVAGITNMEAVRWAELERVVLDDEREDAVLLEDCPKLQLLYASNQTFSKEEGLQLKRAPALCLLKVTECIGKLTGLKAIPKLAVLHLDSGDGDGGVVRVQPAEAGEGFRAVQDVSNCAELKCLTLVGEAIFDGAEDDAGCSFCRPLTNLRTLSLRGWAGLKKLLDLTAHVHLNLLAIFQCQSLEDILGFLPSNLDTMILEDCTSLHRIPSLEEGM